MKDKDFGNDFYIGESENNDFEDVFSTSDDSIDLSSFSGKAQKSYGKKGHGFFADLKKWWKKRKAWQKASIITAVSILLVFAIAFSAIRIMFDYNYNAITDDHEDLGIENVIDKDIVNVALFGLDTRSLDSFEGNSDSIMILSLNTTTKKVKIISVMRDSFVPITYNGKTTYGKINSAYYKGGPELAIKVLNTNFGLDISEYATVNFYGMVDIIDAVGGIDAELTPAEVVPHEKNLYAINACIYEICENLGKKATDHYIHKSGKQHLNGIQAVAYSRIRYVANIWGTNNDYGRTDRQRYVMEQLFNKALTLEKTQYIKLAKSLIPCSETSLSYTEIIGLAFDILLKSPSFSQARMPQQEFLMTAPKTSAGSIVYYDLEFAKNIIHSFIYEDITFEDYIAANGIQKNNWYTGGSTRPRPSVGDNQTNSSTTSNKPSSSSSDTDSTLTSSKDETDSDDKTSSEGTGSEDTTTDGSSSDESSSGGDSLGNDSADSSTDASGSSGSQSGGSSDSSDSSESSSEASAE